MCSLLCNFNCYCTLGASLMLALSAIDVSLHYYYMQNFHRKKKKKKKKPQKSTARTVELYTLGKEGLTLKWQCKDDTLNATKQLIRCKYYSVCVSVCIIRLLSFRICVQWYILII